MHAIAMARTPYKQKFGIPRQPGLAPAVTGVIDILPPFNRPEAFSGIEQFSHLWIEFFFNQTSDLTAQERIAKWKPSVRPPRMGGNAKTGCFATRSNFRPNGIGLSVVAFKGIEISGSSIQLKIAEHDLLDGTPILDIKPYIPYSDAKPTASAGIYTQQPEHAFSVTFTQEARQQLKYYQNELTELELIITQVLQQDPRPAYMKDSAPNKQFTVRLFHLDISWRVASSVEGTIVVDELQPYSDI
jgi:tRNA-Thr(GGU) m(6)t(6)A37 methyltransferase TsaA